MHFILMPNGWRVTFLEEDLKTLLPRKVIFQDAIKVIEMALRGGAGKVLADRQAIEHGVSLGRGSAWLNLTKDQHDKLKKGCNSPR
jgi:hypothetical protein